MTETRNASQTRHSESAAAKAVRTMTGLANRLIEALSPQPQLQPIPVRVRNGRRTSRA